MIDPSSSEEEGDEETVANLPNKGRIGAPQKTVAPVAAPSTSTAVATIPITTSGPNTHDGDFQSNQRPSNTSGGNSRFDGSDGGVGSTKKDQPQFGTEGGSLEVPNNGIPRLV